VSMLLPRCKHISKSRLFAALSCVKHMLNCHGSAAG